MNRFSFSCGKCSEQFNVEFGYLLEKEHVCCPNCSNTLPDDALKHLKTIVTSLNEYEKICEKQKGYLAMTIS